jgi:hypothetical protein
MSSIKDTIKKQIEIQTALDADRSHRLKDKIVREITNAALTAKWENSVLRPAFEAAQKEIEAGTREAGKPTQTKLVERQGRPGQILPALILSVGQESTAITAEWDRRNARASINAVFGRTTTSSEFAAKEEIGNLQREKLDSIFDSFCHQAFMPR